MRRIGSIVPAVLVGLPFAISVGAVSEQSSWRFWGVFFGGLLMALTFDTTLWMSRLGPSRAVDGAGGTRFPSGTHKQDAAAGAR
jgi:hypothetical protein